VLKKYVKGSRVERALIKMFNEAGFSVIRAAGSGVSSLSPDILVFKKGLQYAFEVKAWETKNLNIKKDQYEGLLRWEKNTGITAYVIWKRNHEPFLFIPLSVFHKSTFSYGISLKDAKLIGYMFEKLM